MWQFDQQSKIGLFTYDGAWIKINDELRFIINGETGKLGKPTLESISINQVKWRVHVYLTNGRFAIAGFTLNKGSFLIKIQLSTNQSVTIDDVEMYVVGGQAINSTFNESNTALLGNDLPFDANSNYGGALVDTINTKFGFAYTRKVPDSYPPGATSQRLRWGRIVDENDSQIFGIWMMPAGTPFRDDPFPISRVGRSLLGDVNFNYVL
jgi:hypothetical protein